MDVMTTLQGISLGQNTAYDILMAVAVFAGMTIVLKIVQIVVLARLKRWAKFTKTDLDDTIIDIAQGLRPPFYLLIALFVAVKMVEPGEILSAVIDIGFVLVIVWEVIRAVEKLMDYYMGKRIAIAEAEGQSDKQAQTMVSAFRIVIKIGLWSFGLILALSNIGVNITSLIAGLGVGGIAIALAAQNILADMFSAFSIFIDKPFQVGDYIVVGNESGVVEDIGLKTTRLRTLHGELLVISNRELTSVRIQNFKQMARRRVVFTLGVEYGLPADKLRAIPEKIQAIVGKESGAEFDRCHFSMYGPSSLDFETVFYVNSADYAQYMDVKQRILLSIYEQFDKDRIGFAFPTQTLHIHKA